MRKILVLILLSMLFFMSCAVLKNPDSKRSVIQASSIDINEYLVYNTGEYGVSAAEIVDYYPAGDRVLFTNGKDGSLVILKKVDGALTVESTLKFQEGDVNSVSVNGEIAAVAVAAAVKTDNGKVYFINVSTGSELGSVEVGALPDMVTFTPDGKYLLSANEGEPDETYQNDPDGSISIIEVNYTEPSNSICKTITFKESDCAESKDGISVRTHSYLKNYLSGYRFSKDIEPEYITVDNHSRYAYVSCQENNAIAKIDIASGSVITLKSLGYKDFTSCGIDLVEDGEAKVVSQPFYGLYMPDSLTSFEINGKTYIATANEGDDRADWEDNTSFEDYDVRKVKKLGKLDIVLDSIFLDESGSVKAEYEDLKVSPFDSIDRDKDGDIDTLVGFGGRSFTIWDENLDKVYDSGSLFETYTAELQPAFFNTSNDNMAIEDRSTKKGPEPEAITSGVIDNTTLVFVGLERFGGLFAFDVSNITSPIMLNYTTGRNFNASIDADGEYTDTTVSNTGDLGPEGFHFVSKNESSTGYSQLIIGNEVSGNVRVYNLELKY